jgi:hypothetical protein
MVTGVWKWNVKEKFAPDVKKWSIGQNSTMKNLAACIVKPVTPRKMWGSIHVESIIGTTKPNFLLVELHS